MDNMVFYIIIGTIVLLVILLINLYNNLKTTRNQIENAKSSLDALFVKRSDLIPNLVAVVKQYTQYEGNTLTQVVQLRNSGKLVPLEYTADSDATQAMKNLMIQVENYPELKANTQFTNLQYSWNEAEEQISAGRRFLSSSITQYNNRLSVFPGNMVAGFFGMKAHEWERATETQRQNVNANELFNK